MNKFDISLILPGYTDHEIIHTLGAIQLNKVPVSIAQTPCPTVNFAPTEDSFPVKNLMDQWREQINRNHIDIERSALWFKGVRGVFYKSLPEDYYVNQLPEKSTLPRGKCRKEINISLYPKNLSIESSEATSEIELQFEVNCIKD